MTQVTNPTTPASSVPNAQGGLDIRGTAGDNRLNAGTGNDSVQTRAGNDTIFANAGNDTVRAGKGNDFVDGGAGNDVLFGDAGNDTVAGGSGDDLIYGDDPARSGGGNDVISGGDGNDTIIAGTGNDVVNGDAGNDVLWGGKGQDTVNGGAGNDTISGDLGNDLLTGGAGSDTFFFASAGGSWGVDTITDFTAGEDKIRLGVQPVKGSGGITGTASAFAVLGNTLDANEFVVVSGFNSSSPAADTKNKVIYDSASGLLYFNNAGSVLTVAQLTPGLTIGTSNFELF
jgi:serralysin